MDYLGWNLGEKGQNQRPNRGTDKPVAGSGDGMAGNFWKTSSQSQ